jgi:hypothetical protein
VGWQVVTSQTFGLPIRVINYPKRKEYKVKDYFNEVIKPAVERMRTSMGTRTIAVEYVPSVTVITLREHCRHLEVQYGECTNPACRIAIEDFGPEEYNDA